MKSERVHHLKYDSKYEDVKLHETTRNYQSGGFCRPKVGCYPWVCLAVEPIANKDHDKQQTEGTDWASININNAVLEPKNRSIYISNSLEHRNTLGFGNVFGIIWPSKTGISYDIARNHSCSTNVVFFSATHGDWAQSLMWFDPKRWNDLILTPHGNKDNQQDNPRPRLAYFCFYSAYHMFFSTARFSHFWPTCHHSDRPGAIWSPATSSLPPTTASRNVRKNLRQSPKKMPKLVTMKSCC